MCPDSDLSVLYITLVDKHNISHRKGAYNYVKTLSSIFLIELGPPKKSFCGRGSGYKHLDCTVLIVLIPLIPMLMVSRTACLTRSQPIIVPC